MDINAVSLERAIDNGIEDADILVGELFEFIEAIVYAIESKNTDEINSLVERWRTDEVEDPEVEEDDDETLEDDLDDLDFDED